MTWFGDFRRDCATYEGSPLKHQGVWALFQYRVAHAVYERNPHSQWLLLLYAWRKVTEMTTGMSLPHQARLGSGLNLAHFGPIVVGGHVTVGSDCHLGQGVTLGDTASQGKEGSPTLGNGVYVGVNSLVVGRIRVGDGAMVGALSFVDRDVPAHSVVHGNAGIGDWTHKSGSIEAYSTKSAEK